MKIAICSDVHLEFGQLELENTQNAEVLVLSGDICTACDLRVTDSILSSAKTDRYLDFFTACSRNFPHVVYVMGNHEHYHGDFATSAGILKDALKHLPNIHVLDKEVFTLGDYVFLGGTLWTDMNNEDEMTMNHVSRRMNDFQICENSNEMVNYRVWDTKEDDTKTVKFKTRPATLSPRHVIEDHEAMLNFIETNYNMTPPWMTTIVVGHHAHFSSAIR